MQMTDFIIISGKVKPGIFLVSFCQQKYLKIKNLLIGKWFLGEYYKMYTNFPRNSTE